MPKNYFHVAVYPAEQILRRTWSLAFRRATSLAGKAPLVWDCKAYWTKKKKKQTLCLSLYSVVAQHRICRSQKESEDFLALLSVQEKHFHPSASSVITIADLRSVLKALNKQMISSPHLRTTLQMLPVTQQPWFFFFFSKILTKHGHGRSFSCLRHPCKSFFSVQPPE